MLGDVWGSFFKKPVTRLYPFERQDAPAQFRGKLVWTPGACNGCQLCVKDCPSSAIELITIDKKAKQFVMRYHADRCTYCAQCVQSCRQESLAMAAGQWENAALQRAAFVVHYGNEADIAAVVAGGGAAGAAVAGGPSPA